MNRFQKFLAALVLIELAALLYAWRWRAHVRILPPINWQACLIDDVVSRQIRALENHLDPAQPDTWAKLGEAYRIFGLFPQAEYCYRQLDKLAPPDRSYLYYWGESLDLMGRTGDATKRYEQILEEKLAVPLGAQTTSYCWLNIGQDRLREENVPAAMEALAKAKDIPKAKLLRARVLIRSRRAQEAIVLLDDLMRESPEVVEYSQMMSWAKAALGDQKGAQDYYERSLRSPKQLDKLGPAHQKVLELRKTMGTAAWLAEARRLEARHKLAEALQLTRKAIDVQWAEDRAEQLATLLMELGKDREAIAVAEDSIRRTGGNPLSLDIIGVASLKLGDMDKARGAWKQAAELSSAPIFYNKLAQFATDVSEMQQYQALEAYELGKQAWLSNDLIRAEREFQRATTLNDRHPLTWFYLAETRRALGDAIRAEAAYRRCLEMDPDFGRAWRGLDRLKQTASMTESVKSP